MSELQSVVAEQVGDVCDLVLMLEISLEELIDRFGDKILEQRDKFGLPDSTDGILDEEDDYDSETEE